MKVLLPEDRLTPYLLYLLIRCIGAKDEAVLIELDRVFSLLSELLHTLTHVDIDLIYDCFFAILEQWYEIDIANEMGLVVMQELAYFLKTLEYLLNARVF